MIVRPVVLDSALAARIVSRRALRYRHGADAAADRPAYVRAASALAWVGSRLAVVQDDANFIALVDPDADANDGDGSAACDAIHLPAGHDARRQFDDERGNKAHKLDLESCITFGQGDETMLVAFGSGSTSAREQVVIVTGVGLAAPRIEVIAATEMYAMLRAAHDFAGTELNIEGAVLLGERELQLFGRGNGATRDGRAPVNATCALDWPALWAHLRDRDRPLPQPHSITHYDLGTLDGVPLGFTDAIAWDGGILFSAAAEASPDSVQDGEVAGSVLGVISRDGSARSMSILDERGAGFTGKIEGLARGRERGTVHAVADEDHPGRASELCEIRIEGGGRG